MRCSGLLEIKIFFTYLTVIYGEGMKWPIDYNAEYEKIKVLRHIATVLFMEKDQELVGKCTCNIRSIKNSVTLFLPPKL